MHILLLNDWHDKSRHPPAEHDLKFRAEQAMNDSQHSRVD